MKTVPPSAAELTGIRSFERDLRERGERDARLENLANVRRRTTLRLAACERQVRGILTNSLAH
jgi:hypothetical protein